MKKYIEFKKQRELGDILTDTFGFIRNEFKPFLRTILQLSGPYLLLFLVALVFYIYTVGREFSMDLNNLFPFDNILSFSLAYIFYIIGAVLAYTFATSTALHYIKSYVKNSGQVHFDEVKNDVNRTFWPFLGLSLLKGLTLVFSILICCLPVFYTMVPMTIVLSIFVFKELKAMDAFSESFSLIKEEFWITLATVIVFAIIVGVIGSIFSIPTAIYTWMKMGVFSGEIDPANMKSLIDPIYVILNILSSFFQYALNLIMVIGAAFIYFNLNERKNFTGTFERIQSIGKTDD